MQAIYIVLAIVSVLWSNSETILKNILAEMMSLKQLR